MKRATTAKLPKKTSAKVNDPDNPAWTEDMLGTPVIKRGRGPQAAPTKVLTSVRLDADILAFFKRQGAGWLAVTYQCSASYGSGAKFNRPSKRDNAQARCDLTRATRARPPLPNRNPSCLNRAAIGCELGRHEPHGVAQLGKLSGPVAIGPGVRAAWRVVLRGSPGRGCRFHRCHARRIYPLPSRFQRLR